MGAAGYHPAAPATCSASLCLAHSIFFSRTASYIVTPCTALISSSARADGNFSGKTAPSNQAKRTGNSS